MTGLPILDLVAGLIFVYFLLSIINNSLIELVSAVFNLRARYMLQWLLKTFNADLSRTSKEGRPPFYQLIIDHPIIDGLSKSGICPNYISSKQFASALVDIICSDQNSVPNGVVEMQKVIASTQLVPDQLRSTLLMFLSKSLAAEKRIGDNVIGLEHFTQQVEEWYDHAMDRVGGVFKRSTMKMTLLFSIVATFSLNVDSITLAQYLYQNPEIRQKVAASALGAIQDSSYISISRKIKKAQAAVSDSSNTDSVRKQKNISVDSTLDQTLSILSDQSKTILETYSLINTSIPIGWGQADVESCRKAHPNGCWLLYYLLEKLPGFIVTILALNLGAPFWFDVLGKIANLRSSIKPAKSTVSSTQ